MSPRAPVPKSYQPRKTACVYEGCKAAEARPEPQIPVEAVGHRRGVREGRHALWPEGPRRPVVDLAHGADRPGGEPLARSSAVSFGPAAEEVRGHARLSALRTTSCASYRTFAIGLCVRSASLPSSTRARPCRAGGRAPCCRRRRDPSRSRTTPGGRRTPGTPAGRRAVVAVHELPADLAAAQTLLAPSAQAGSSRNRGFCRSARAGPTRGNPRSGGSDHTPRRPAPPGAQRGHECRKPCVPQPTYAILILSLGGRPRTAQDVPRNERDRCRTGGRSRNLRRSRTSWSVIVASLSSGPIPRQASTSPPPACRATPCAHRTGRGTGRRGRTAASPRREASGRPLEVDLEAAAQADAAHLAGRPGRWQRRQQVHSTGVVGPAGRRCTAQHLDDARGGAEVAVDLERRVGVEQVGVDAAAAR